MFLRSPENIKKQCAKIQNRIFTIEKIEDIIGIGRYKVGDIKTNINLGDVKAKLTGIVEDIAGLNVTGTTKEKVRLDLKTKINKIDSINKLQKFIADQYNTFGSVIGITSKRQMIKGERDTYYSFQLNSV